MKAAYRSTSAGQDASKASRKWRLPCAAWPATAASKPCRVWSSSSASHASASRSGGTAKSSVISVVPDGRAPPTAVTNALRAFQKPAMVRGSRVRAFVTDGTGATRGSSRRTERARSS